MPGKRIPLATKPLFLDLSESHSLQAAAARAGFSEWAGYRIIADPDFIFKIPAPKKSTRPDPLEPFFDSVTVPLLQRNPEIQAARVHDYLLERVPEYRTQYRRTLERRISTGRLDYGPDEEVYASEAVIFNPWHRFCRCGRFSRMAGALVFVEGEFSASLAEFRRTVRFSVGGRPGSGPAFCRDDLPSWLPARGRPSIGRGLERRVASNALIDRTSVRALAGARRRGGT